MMVHYAPQNSTQRMSQQKGGLSTQADNASKEGDMETHEHGHLQAKELLEQPKVGIEPTDSPSTQKTSSLTSEL